MSVKKVFQATLICVIIIGCIASNAGAILVNNDVPVEYEVTLGLTRASGSFNMDIPARTKKVADSSFSLDKGETVRINAVYFPDASVDFGLIDDDDVFHYINVTDGSIDKTIQISERGNYTLQIRNNSSIEVTVSGFVQY